MYTIVKLVDTTPHAVPQLPALIRIRTTNAMLSTELELSRPDAWNWPCEGYLPATAPRLLRGCACALGA